MAPMKGQKNYLLLSSPIDLTVIHCHPCNDFYLAIQFNIINKFIGLDLPDFRQLLTCRQISKLFLNEVPDTSLLGNSDVG